MDKAAVAMASRTTTPVKDDLVERLAGIFPVLKSGEGIPVVKHTKRGQSDHRRLRLDTDDSTLEVFRRGTTASYLNRKMSNRRYNLRMLEEVGPATSVPGGQGGKAATPGRTVVFVFRNRNLYVTVETRDVCAALVALFRPAGAAPQPSGLPEAITAQASEDGDSVSASKRKNASPSSPSSEGPSVRGGGRSAAAAGPRRASENAASARDLLERQPGPGSNLTQIGWSSVQDDNTGKAESNGGFSSRRSRNRGAGASGGRRGASSRHYEARLRRSASETAGAALFDGTSTSSSDEDGGMGTVAVSTTTTDPSVERSQQRSPKSTSESPDAIMRSRMVGFGSADLGMSDEKPKRAGRTSSIRPRWPFADSSEKKSTPVATSASASAAAAAAASASAAAAAAMTSRLKTDLAVEDSAETEEDVEVTTTEEMGLHVTDVPKPGGPTSVPTHDQSPLAVRVEDRLDIASLCRPASAPSNVVATEAKELSASQDTPPIQPRPMPRMVNSSPPETLARTAPQLARSRVSTPPQAPAATVVPLQNEGEFDFAYPRRPEPMPSAVHTSPAVAAIPPHPVPAKIPPLARPAPTVVDALQQQQGLETKAATAAVVNAQEPGGTVYRDRSSDSSFSPTAPQHRPVPAMTVPASAAVVTPNGTHVAAGALGRGGALVKHGYNRSSSMDSLEGENPYHRHGESSASFMNAAHYSEADSSSSSGQENAAAVIATVEHLPSQSLRAEHPVEPDGRGAQELGKGRHRDGEEVHRAVPVSGVKTESTAVSHTSRDLPFLDERHASVVQEKRGGAKGGAGAVPGVGTGEEAAASRALHNMAVDRIESFATSRTDSSGPPTFDNAVTRLTIQTDHSQDEYAAPSEAGTSVRNDNNSLPFATTPAAAAAAATMRAAFNSSRSSRGSRGSRGSYDGRGSGGTDCTSPGSPPGGAVGEVRASTFHAPAGARAIPRISGLHLNGAGPRDQRPQGPSGFEELWAVMEPAWDINSSFGASFAPKAMLLGDIYESMRNFQAAVASVCVRACGPVLGEVCGRCARAWAVLISTSVEDMVLCQDVLRKIHSGVVQLIDVVERYEASAVVRRFALPLIGVGTAWEELLAAGEGGDMQEPCLRIEEAMAQLPEKERDVGKRTGAGGTNSSKGGRRLSGTPDLRLPPCPSYWAKGQFDQLTPNGLTDVLTLLHEPARFAELAELVTRASDVGPANREYSLAWDCVRRMEGPALGRELRRALSATLVSAGELLPLPRVPPPPPAYVPREEFTEQIEATILHPFLPLGIAGIGGASGSGKTVLAATVVRDATVRCRFGDRVFWLHAGKGANQRLVSVLQALADTVYAWLTDGDHALSSSASPSQRSRRNSSGGGDAGGGLLADPNLREPVRFRDQDQAVNYVADLCRGPLLAGLRCLVVLDDVHEREVVDALWKSGCQLLVTSPVEGLLQAVGAEATMSAPLSLEFAKEVTTKAAGEEIFCEEANKLVELCRGCPLALAMSGAVAQAVLSGGNDAREYRRPGLATPRKNLEGGEGGGGGGAGEGGGRGVVNIMGSGWSLSTLAAPVGAWVEQVVVGTSGPAATNRPPANVRRPAPVPEENFQRAAGANGDGLAAGAGTAAAEAASRMDPEAMAWASLARRVNSGLAALKQSRTLHGLLAEAGPEEEMPVRELMAVLTELALQEADRILGGSGWATECYLSFALLPDGMPLPPPALEEFWRRDDDGQGGGEGAGGGNRGYANGSESHLPRPPAPVEVFEALRMVGRAGGGEGADGLIPHGLQRTMINCMAQRHPEVMQKMTRRRVQMLSKISALVGTFDDDCWGLRAMGGANAGTLVGAAPARSGGEDAEVVDVIPSGLLGSRRPGPPTHGYGGFSRYDYLVASWDALPSPHTLASAASNYVSSVRASCQAVVAAEAEAGTAQNGDGTGASGAGGISRGGGWPAARALASVADLEALAGRRSEAIRAYGEACAILAVEAARAAKVAVIQNKERAARDSHHKVASLMQELAVLLAQFGREAPAIRLLQRAVEMHLSALEASGVLIPHPAGGGNQHRSELNKPDAEAAAATAAANEDAHGRGAGITYRAVVDDVRPVSSRLFLQSSKGVGQHPASGRGGDGNSGGGTGSLPAFGRLDVVGTCVGDLGLVLACTRSLQQEQKIDESVQLAEKVYPVLKEILGADHAFTKTALAVFAGQAIVDECFAQADADGSSSGGHPPLPSPTSRRRLARSSGGRGGNSAAGGGGSGGGGAGGLGGGVGGGGSGGGAQNTVGSSSLAASTLSDLSVPPSPLPEEFYARYSSSVNGAINALGTRGVSGGGGHRSRRGYSTNGSASSGTEGDDGEDTDSRGSSGALGGPRRAGPVGGGAYSRLSFPRRALNRGGVAQGWEQSEVSAVGGGAGGGALGRGTLEPASSRMQQEFYFQHRTRRARAHAFLITAATRARIKNANRAEAGLFLRDLGRLAGGASGRNGNGNGDRGLSTAAMSPDGTAQMERLTRRR